MYRAVCLDLDGTLVDDDKRISRRSLRVLRILQRRGVEIIIATGRGLSKARQMTMTLDFPFTMIANNGAVIEDNDRQILAEYTVDRDLFFKVYEEGKKRSLLPYLYIVDPEKSLLLPEDTKAGYHRGSVADVGELAYYVDYKKEPRVLSIVYIDEKDKLTELEQVVGETEYPCATHLIRAFDRDKMLYEIQNPKATKNRSIREALARKGISLKEVAALGDDNNDLLMIRDAGLGIAMKNGTETVKQAADIVSEYDNNDDGAAIELEKVFNIGKKIQGLF